MESVKEARICRRFSRALTTYNRYAEAQQIICRHLATLLTTYTDNRFGRVLEIGCGSGGFTKLLKAGCQIDEWVINDLCPDCAPVIRSLFPDASQPVDFRPGNAEKQFFSGKYHLIASASAFQWMDNLPLFFEKLVGHLTDGGYLLFNTFAPDNLTEIRQLTGQGLNYPSIDQLKAWLLPHFRLLHVEETTIRLTFPSPEDVLRHLKYTGVTATGNAQPWTRRIQSEFSRRYRDLFPAEPHQVTLTYRPIYLLGVKKEK